MSDFYRCIFNNSDPNEAIQALERIPVASRADIVSYRNREGEAPSHGESPLHAAVRAGNLGLVSLLLDSGCDLDCRRDDECTPAFLASARGHPAILLLLLSAGADKEARDADDRTPLWIAAHEGIPSAAETLLDSGADPDAANSEGKTPLWIASQKGHLAVVQLLLQNSASADMANSDGRTPLWIASQKGHLAAVQLLLAAGADPHLPAASGASALLVAAQFGHDAVVRRLLEAGADGNAAKRDGITPLWIAAFGGHQRVAEALAEWGADPSAANKKGTSPLFIAAEGGHAAVVALLLAAGADKSARKSDGRTPLWAASFSGHHRAAELLLAAGAEPGARRSDRSSPLHVAAANGHPGVVELLLAAGAEKDAPREDGSTPLFVAAEKGRRDAVEMLLSAGADKKIACKGQTPLQIARANNHTQVVQLLASPFPPQPRGLLKASLVNLNRVKLMVVGRAAVGKTTLLRSLFGQAFDPTIPSTDGIDLGEFTFEGVQFMTWDFGGQKVYRFTHQLFLTPNALYLVLFNLSDNIQESLKELRFWLNSIGSRCPEASFFIVATHADKFKPDEQLARCQVIREALISEYPQHLARFHHIFPISPTNGKGPLQEAIHQAARVLNIQAPENYVRSLGQLLNLQYSPPILSFNDAVTQLTVEHLQISTRAHIVALLEAFHHLGFITSFPNPHTASGGTIILKPQWIARLLSSIVTTKHRMVNSETGLISHHALTTQLWLDHNEFPPDKHQDLVHLLSELDILFPMYSNQSLLSSSSSDAFSLNELTYFIPCMLREEAPDIRFFLPPKILTESAFKLHRRFQLTTAVPVAVIPPLMIDLMKHGELRARWQQGCLARLPTSDNQGMIWVQLWRSQANIIELKIWGESSKHTTIWMRQLSSMLKVRLTEFYHLEYEIVIPCPECPEHGGYFKWHDLQSSILDRGIETSCLPDGHHSIRIDSLAPELCFHDLDADGFIVPWDALTELSVLGRGAFGSVLKMSIPAHLLCNSASSSSSLSLTHIESPPRGHPLPASNILDLPSSSSAAQPITVEVAVKLLDKSDEENPVKIFQEFQHEVYLMSALKDPNIVPLLGICLTPRLAMIMEVVGGGTLYDQLNDPLGLRSSLFGFVEMIDNEFSNFKTVRFQLLDFKNIFINRSRLSEADRIHFEQRCIEGLPEALRNDNALNWIEQQISQDTRHPAITSLRSKPMDTYFQLTEDKLSEYDLPMMPELTTLGHRALDRAQSVFNFWKDILSRRDLSRMNEVEIFESRFFTAIYELDDAYRNDLAFKQLKQIKEQTEQMLDDLNILSTQHLPIIAPISPMLRFKLALDVCRGMVYLHHLNPPIIHRDLKTPNIFLTRSLIELSSLFNDNDVHDEVWNRPLAKVGDFGLSLMISMGGTLRFENNNLNPTWAAPEILQGAKYTPAVDVYAMGFIMWELLMREHPFKETPEHLIADHVIHGGRPLISEQVKADPINQRFIQLIESCWHQNPTERPQMSMVNELLIDLARQHQYKPFLNSQLSLPSAHQSLTLSTQSSMEFAPTVQSYSVIPSPPTASSSTICFVCSKPLSSSKLKRIFSKPSKLSSVCSIGACKQCGTFNSSCPRPTPVHNLGITCMLIPFEQRELMWFGFENGYVGVIDYHQSRSNESDTNLTPILCHPHESHPQSVNAMLSFSGYGESETIWSGSEDGTLSVWTSQPQLLEEIYDATWMQGSLKNDKGVVVWVECENGRLSWFSKRYDIKPIRTIQMSSQVRDVQISPEFSLLDITLVSSKHIRFSPAADDLSLMQEWFLKLKNLTLASRSSLVRLASFQHSKAGIVALQSMDRLVWSADTHFVLNEWSLTSAADTGLHETLKLTSLRQVQLDVSPLRARLRTICGFIRVHEDMLWIGVGDRWVIMHTGNLSVVWYEDPFVKMDKLIAVIPVQHNLHSEVWSLDDDGRLFVWTASVQENYQPEFIGEMIDPSYKSEEDGKMRCLQQVHPEQVWVGTSTSKVLAWNLVSRHLIPSQLQPMPSGHPAVYQRGDQFRSVRGIVSLLRAHPPIVWTVAEGSLLQLRRFSF